MKPHLGEINIICTDLDRSLRFYRDVVGFEAVEQEGPAWHMRFDGVGFLLLAVATRERSREPYASAPEISIDILVDDLVEARRHFERHGVEIVLDPPPNDRRFFVRDPDGNVVEVIAGPLPGPLRGSAENAESFR